MSEDAQMSYNDAVAAAIKSIAEGSHASDRAIFELVQALVTRVLALEEQVSMLMELHKVE